MSEQTALASSRLAALFARKPTEWREVPFVDASRIDDAGVSLTGLPLVSIEDAYGCPRLAGVRGPLSDFASGFVPPSTLFLLEAGADGIYLIDTRGYGHGRYWMRVTGAGDLSLCRFAEEVAAVVPYLSFGSATVKVQTLDRNVLRVELTDGRRFDIEIRPGSGAVH